MSKYLDLVGLTLFKRQLDSTYATSKSPSFTGIPTAPTAATGTSSVQIATTEFVQQEVSATVGTISITEVDALFED